MSKENATTHDKQEMTVATVFELLREEIPEIFGSIIQRDRWGNVSSRNPSAKHGIEEKLWGCSRLANMLGYYNEDKSLQTIEEKPAQAA